MTVLRIRNLSVAVQSLPVLEGIDLDIQTGRILGLVGESGSGKSMTALAVMGLLPHGAHAQGHITLNGTELLGLSDAQMNRIRGRKISMIFQEPMTALNPLMTIGDQIAEVLRLHQNISRRQSRRIAREKLDRVGLPAPRFSLNQYPHQLSGGQRQRVAIAIAIAQRPDLLIADEPTTALDVTTQAAILDLLTSLVREEGMSLLLITHDLAVVAGRADRVVVMQSGRIIESGGPATIFAKPREAYTKALIAASTYQPARKPAATTTEPLLEVIEASREYRLPRPSRFAARPVLQAVDAVSLSIAKGQSLGLVGESGSGKTTLTRAILGLDALQGGSIRLDGEKLLSGRAMPQHMRAKMQAVFQDPFGSFDPRQTVETLVAEPFHLTGRPLDWRDRVAEALREVGIDPAAGKRHIHAFSGGQRQRIAIARALVIKPRLIILDEAVSALDVRVRAQVLDLLAGLREEFGVSYLFISHDLQVVRAVTDRVAIMNSGRIIEEGPTEAVFSQPQMDYTRALIAAAPALPSTPAF